MTTELAHLACHSTRKLLADLAQYVGGGGATCNVTYRDPNSVSE